MRVLITSGATREPIDDVRYVSNVSTGRLGASVATAFLEAGAEATLMTGVGSQRPEAHPDLTVVEFGSTEDLLSRLRVLLGEDDAPSVMIHAAAVADYAPIQAAGKISSSADELVLRMTPTPKVADRVRRWRPDLTLVMFKLESGITRDELHARARRTMARAGADHIVANLLEEVTPGGHRADLLSAGGQVTELPDRDAIGAALVRLAMPETAR